MSTRPLAYEPEPQIEERTATVARARAFGDRVVLYVRCEDDRLLEISVEALEAAALAINITKSAGIAMREELARRSA